MCDIVLQLNMRNDDKFGLSFDQSSSGVTCFIPRHGTLLIKYAAVTAASTQNLLFKPLSNSMQRTFSIIVWFILSDSVLFRRIGYSSLVKNPMLGKKRLEPFVIVFSAVVAAKFPYLSTQPFLSKIFEINKFAEYLVFSLRRIQE